MEEHVLKLLPDWLTRRPAPEITIEPAPPITCPRCQTTLTEDPTYEVYRVCGQCGHHFSQPACERIGDLLDPGSFRETNASLEATDPLHFTDRQPYPERIKNAQRETGLNDAIVTGVGSIDGQRAVIAVLEFQFLGGSMGSVVGEKVARAFELAAAERLPIVTIAASGGARMQEGMLSLVQMAKTAGAAERVHAAGCPFISVLTNPTTGGVMSSFAALGDVILAEPNALVGFAGPRVAEAVMGRRLPEGSHTAEFFLAHGLADAIVARPDLRYTLATLLRLMQPRQGESAPALLPAPSERPLGGWEATQLARLPHRPTSLDYLARLAPTFFELHGDRLSADDPAVVTGLAAIGGRNVAVVAQERGHGATAALRHEGKARPEGYRKAERMMRLAAKLHLPLLALVDTPGAYPGLESEERGLPMALARCLATLTVLPTQVVTAVVGEGASGGALALGVADRILMQENAIYSVISPEGAAAIIYRDDSRAPEVAEALRLTASDCLELGVVDRIIPEPEGGAHLDAD
ncbi:MAG: acetyl-CoA carboxylase, carboxyltransferase subunit beta, partial [Chloroflexi bacterium]|nr:acetyl-CoA carboxylase, carboxyltransferase subunit beta [Chloroflexota bacterium]